MGLFDKVFGGKNSEQKKEKEPLPWIPLNSIDQLDIIDENSKSKTQVIFKHSTTCGISRMVMNMFQSSYDFSKDQIDLHYLDLLSYRSVSDETGYKFQVIHQSPQLLVIRNGVAVANASHGAISEIDLSQYV